jgi:hypothetical protein
MPRPMPANEALEQDRSDTEKNRKPKSPERGALGTLANRGLGPVMPGAHILRRSSGGNLEPQPCQPGLDPFWAPLKIFRGVHMV